MQTAKQVEIALSPEDVLDMVITYADSYLVVTDEEGKDYIKINKDEKFYLTDKTIYKAECNNRGQFFIRFAEPQENDQLEENN